MSRIFKGFKKNSAAQKDEEEAGTGGGNRSEVLAAAPGSFAETTIRSVQTFEDDDIVKVR